jgi:hypothetical protein
LEQVFPVSCSVRYNTRGMFGMLVTKLARTLVFAVVIFGVLEGSSWLTASVPPCLMETTKEEQATYANNQPDCPIFSAGSQILLARLDTFVERHDKSIVASFTILLALSTIGLWWSTRELWKTTRNEFLSTHRPKLIVRQFILQPPVVNDVLRVEFSIINIGNTDAKVTGVAAEVALWNGRFWERPGLDRNVRPFGPRVVRNGERISVVITSRFNLAATQLIAIQQGVLMLCAVGEFTYTDALGIQRRTGFRRNYEVTTDMFTTSPNPDQEYQD